MEFTALGMFIGGLGLICILVIIKEYVSKYEITKVNKIILKISICLFIAGIITCLVGLITT